MATRQLLPVATDAQTWSLARRLLRPHRWYAVATGVVLLAGTGAGLLAAPVLGEIVDRVIGGRTATDPASAFAGPALLLAVVAVAHGAGTAAGTAMVARLGEYALAGLRELFLRRALGLPLARIEAAGAGDLTARASRDVSAVADAIRYALPTLIRSALTIVLTLVALAVLDWRFLLAALLATPIQFHTVRWYTRTAGPVYAEGRIATGAQQQQLLDTYAGAPTVRSFSLEAGHLDLVRNRSAEATTVALRGIGLLSRFFNRLNIAEFVALSGVLALACLLIPSNSATAGTATAAALYLHNLFNPVNAALGLADFVQVARAALRRLAGIAVLAEEQQAASTSEPADAAVTVKGVSFGYREGHTVLHDVSLRIEPGERVALVGTSGAGKTTLAALICGVHPPASGLVELGGTDVSTMDASTLRRHVVLISQEVHVFAGPLHEDLRLARPDATAEDLTAALDRAGAGAWARALPDGLDTVVGDGGHRLTAAQSQQVALARLILADPPVVILDEATADAGSAGARELEQAAAEALRGRTALVVAHRLSQAATADRVVLLEAGRIAEEGRHEDLVASGGRYARLWETWSRQRG
ncbi:ABC transporter ATP-binding protein [Longispora albida]|uniref:ABC transporter ATP-binding protein n=1 Tax=Longispora albida TaxID=203523 RepID=UPI00037251F1|nr:ABC transporter ATP-binding protein [Longispora albida]